MTDGSRKRPASPFLDDSCPEPSTKRSKGGRCTHLLFLHNHPRFLLGEAKFTKASLALSRGRLVLLPESQSRLGGWASCPFATLGLGSALLEYGAFEDAVDAHMERKFSSALNLAVSDDFVSSGGRLLLGLIRLKFTKRPVGQWMSTPTRPISRARFLR